MNNYGDALNEVPVRQGKKKVNLDNDEMKIFRKITEQVSWLASNCRPDLCFKAPKLSIKNKEATLEDMKYAFHVIKNAKSRASMSYTNLDPSLIMW